MGTYTNGDMPAMPIEHEHAMQLDTRGLTKREWFAGMAMQGLLSGEYREWSGRGHYKDVAKFSVEQADALLAALAHKMERSEVDMEQQSQDGASGETGGFK